MLLIAPLSSDTVITYVHTNKETEARGSYVPLPKGIEPVSSEAGL